METKEEETWREAEFWAEEQDLKHMFIYHVSQF